MTPGGQEGSVPGPYGKTGTFRHGLPRSKSPPPRGALSSGAVGPSPAHGRQQAGPGRVGLRSAGFRGRQATGFEAKGILKDHGSLSRSLVTFCRLRKSLALRRKYLFPPAIQFWYRGLRPLCPPAARPVVAPYVLRIRRGVSGVGPAHRRAKKAPLKRGLSAELTGGFCPRCSTAERNPPA